MSFTLISFGFVEMCYYYDFEIWIHLNFEIIKMLSKFRFVPKEIAYVCIVMHVHGSANTQKMHRCEPSLLFITNV